MSAAPPSVDAMTSSAIGARPRRPHLPQHPPAGRALARPPALGRPRLRPDPTAPAAPVPRAETVYRPADPLDVRLTLGPLLRGRSNPVGKLDPRTGDVWLTILRGGGATIVVRPVRDGARIIAWGPGAERAVADAPELLGRGDSREALDLARHPWLAETARRNPGLRLCRTNAVFESLAPAILEQKITVVEAHRAWAALHRAYADPPFGPAELVPPGMTMPLRPEQWRSIPSWAWHRAGVDYSRTTTLLRAAEVASALERTLGLDGLEAGARPEPGAGERSGTGERTAAVPGARGGEEITRRLRSLRGVGVWTAAETTQRSHGDPDAPSFGDYHLAAHVGWAFTGGPVDDEGMRELLEPWRGQRQRIVRLLMLSGRGKPRRGPRMTIQDHRAI